MKREWHKSTCAFFLVFTLIVGLLGNANVFFSQANEGGTYKELTFKDWGIENGAYGNGVGYSLKDASITTLDKTAFTGKFTYNTANDFRIGGNSNPWAGLTFMVSNGHLYVSDESDSVGGDDIMLTNTTVSKTETFELRLTFDKGTSENEWTIGIYVNGEHKKDLTDTMNLGTAFLVNGNGMVLEDVISDVPEPEPTYKELTFKDWGIEDGTYTNGVGYSLKDTSITTLDQTAFTGKFTYNTASDFRIGGNSNPWAGLTFMVNNGHLYISDESDSVGGDDITLDNTTVSKTEAFELRLTFDKGTAANEWTIGIYVNGEHKHDFTDTMNLGTAFLVNGNGMILGEKSQEPDNPLDDYKKLTFKDWGIVNGAYTNGVGYSLKDTSITTLNQTAFTGKFTYNTASDFRIGGNSNPWAGLTFMVNNGHLYVSDETDSATGDDITLDNTTVSKTEAFELCLTFDKGAAANEWTVGIYVDGEHKHDFTDTMNLGTAFLVNGSGMVLKNVPDTGEEPGPEPDPNPKPDESRTYKEYTFSDWGILDGEYIAAQPYEMTAGRTSLNGVSFRGKFDYSNGSGNMRIGGKDNAWAGILIGVRGNQLVVDCEVEGFSSIDTTISYPEKNLSKEAFELRLTFDYMKNGNLELGIWIDGTFQRYLVYNNMAKSVGSKMLFDGNGIVLEDVGKKENGSSDTKKEVLPKGFKEVTFKSFGIKNGTYKFNNNDLSTKGKYMLPLDKTIFSGDMYFCSNQMVDFRYGGLSNDWFGLIFNNTEDGRIYMQGIADNVVVTDTYIFNPAKAGTKLTDAWFNLKLSTEIVDSDGDGKKDDVKLGVWFNNVLYNNKYIELKDYAQYLGSRMSVFVRGDGGFVKLKSDSSVYTGVDFALFGFTRNWDAELGER